MAKKQKPDKKPVKFSINTTQDHLDSIGLSIDDVKDDVLYLAKIFGMKYERLFPLNINQSDINYFHYLTKILKPIDNAKGFKRFIRQIDKNNLDDHIFTAKVSKWLLELGFCIELEPEIESTMGGRPDILVENNNFCAAVECKNFDIDSLYNHEEKRSLSDLVFRILPTCDQIDLYLKDELSATRV